MDDETENRERGQILVAGHLFADAVFSQLPSAPVPGQEIWATDFSFTPGGIANQAIAAHRLGCPVSLRATIGDDALSHYCVTELVREGLDTGRLQEVDGWRLPMTASLGFEGDRALVSGGPNSALPLDLLTSDADQAAVAILHWEDGSNAARRLADEGVKVIADVGWDNVQSGPDAVLPQLDGVYAFTPNRDEALACTGSATVEGALEVIGSRVELAVITLGGEGVIAREQSTGTVVRRPGWSLPVVDTTGAGDVFAGALAAGILRGWPLIPLLDLALLVAGICVSRSGGAFSTPTLAELRDWIDAAPADLRERAATLRPLLTAPHPHPTQQESE